MFKNPEAWAWNLTVERELFWNSHLTVGYVARRGLHLQRESDINQPTTAEVARIRTQHQRFAPYKGFGSIRETDNVASSMLQLAPSFVESPFQRLSPVRRLLHVLKKHG